MKLSVVFAFFCWGTLTLLSQAETTENKQNGLQLKFVQLVTRHGARTAFSQIPNHPVVWNCHLTELSLPDYTPHKHEETIPRVYRKKYIRDREGLLGNCSTGQLTTEGYQMHYKLGQQFRSHYIDDLQFLPPTYNPNVFYVRSTDSPRTIQSAEAQLLGFYPSSASSPTPIIDIETIDVARDDLAPNNRCPAMMSLCNAAQNTSTWNQYITQYYPLQQKLQKLWNVDNIVWADIYDTLYALSWHGFPMPSGITTQIYQQIAQAQLSLVTYLYSNREVQKLGIGPFIGELLDSMVDNIQGKSSYKWKYYSAHDVTIALLLSAFNAFEQTGYWPPYASHLLFELYADNNNDYYVRVIYNDVVITLPGCTNTSSYGPEYCSFATFSQLAQSAIPDNWAHDCGLQKQQHSRRGASVSASASNEWTFFFC